MSAVLRPAADAPGRICPMSYRYAPRVFDRAPEIVADTVYVAGGIYGNVEALEALARLASRERGAVQVVVNGDFHWFDVDPADFRAVNAAALAHHALRGNVETEVAGDDASAGCGCAYPADVADAEVASSNRIIERLRATARALPAERSRLAALPMHRVARVGEARVAIVHGDAASLAGWGFARERLDAPAHRRWIEAAFADARVDAFASSHTCLPALRRFAWEGGEGVVANNGAAGMPNHPGTRHGLVTRLAVAPFAGAERVAAMRVRGMHVEALRLDYDHERWLARFLASWPPGSAAHDAYFRRMTEGPRGGA